MRLQASLPLPPSTNNLYASVPRKGRVVRRVSKEYEDWREQAGRALGWPRVVPDRAHPRAPQPPCPPWRIDLLAVNLPGNRDLDNLIKPTVDLVCAMTGLRDRKASLRRVVAEWSDAPGVAPHLAVAVTILD